MRKVIIFGCGRGADVSARYFSDDSNYEVCGFTVNKEYLIESQFRGLPLVDFDQVEQHFPPHKFELFVPLGFQAMNTLRAEKYFEGKRKGYTFATYVSSRISSHGNTKFGENCLILENSSINFDVQIGNNVVIWSAAQIGDNCEIGDHVWVTSHAVVCGAVRLGQYSFLGANCTIADRVTVAPRTFIGATTFISKDTEEGSVYVTAGSKPLGIDSKQFSALLS